MTIMVTGGAGFIGSNFVRYLTDLGEHVHVLDNLTYAGDLRNLRDINKSKLYFTEGDINDTELVFNLLATYDPIGIVHFAAESHVDNSINNASPFVITNVNGTVSLLEATKKWLLLRHRYTTKKQSFRFHHVSTDEVYGSLSLGEPAFTESNLYAPRSPYSASKAASDHFVAAYGATHNIPYVMTNCSNNYGRRQHKEKLIPVVITKAMNDLSIPMYADGANIRDWIHVRDHCEALWRVFVYGKDNSKYNIGGKTQVSNKELITTILNMMGKPLSLITSVTDRLGHDFRYDIDNTKIETELRWYPRIPLDIGLKDTIEWYRTQHK